MNRQRVIRLALTISALSLASFFSSGCATKTPFDPIDSRVYSSGTTYTYQPLNPTTIWIRDPSPQEVLDGYSDGDETSRSFYDALLRDLDTETVRIAVNSLSGDVSTSAGVVGVTTKGESYSLIIDYIKYITCSHEIDVDYTSTSEDGEVVEKNYTGSIPVYTGIGLRIRAEFVALEGGLNISGLPALSVAANAKNVSGRLTVQTLGITGSEISSLMPLVSDISVSSIQSSVQSVAAIKAKMYEDSTVIYPKIIGFESPDRDANLIRAITESLYSANLWICPVMIKDPADASKKKLSIFWFDPPPED